MTDDILIDKYRLLVEDLFCSLIIAYNLLDGSEGFFYPNYDSYGEALGDFYKNQGDHAVKEFIDKMDARQE